MPTGVIDWIHLLNAEEDSDYHPLEKKKKRKNKKTTTTTTDSFPIPCLETFCSTFWFGPWRHSALCDAPVFIFIFIFMEYINLEVQRCIQSLVKNWGKSFFVKGINCSWLSIVFARNLLLGCWVLNAPLRYFKLF